MAALLTKPGAQVSPAAIPPTARVVKPALVVAVGVVDVVEVTAAGSAHVIHVGILPRPAPLVVQVELVGPAHDGVDLVAAGGVGVGTDLRPSAAPGDVLAGEVEDDVPTDNLGVLGLLDQSAVRGGGEDRVVRRGAEAGEGGFVVDQAPPPRRAAAVDVDVAGFADGEDLIATEPAHAGGQGTVPR